MDKFYDINTKAIKDFLETEMEGFKSCENTGYELSQDTAIAAEEERYIRDNFECEDGINDGCVVVKNIYYFADEVIEKAKAIAYRVSDSDTWDAVDCKELCMLARLEQEWSNSDGEGFESVVFEAAERLGIEI